MHIILHKQPFCYAGLKNPFTFMSYVTPVMAIVTAIISIVMDPWEDLRANHFFDSNAHIIRSSLLMFLGGALAFFMVCILYPFLVTILMPSLLLSIDRNDDFLILKISTWYSGICFISNSCPLKKSRV
jgi:hypothetical protein